MQPTRAKRLYDRSPGWTQTVLLNAYAWSVERHRYGRPYRAALAECSARERWSPERIREWQDARLRQVIATAWERSRFYRERWSRAGIDPTEIRSVEDLRRLPILTRAEVRERMPDLLTADRPRRGWLYGHTSGTTGSPLGLWYDRATCILTNAVDRRHKRWAGMADDDWIGLLLGRVVVPTGRRRPPFWRTNWIQRQVWFSSFHLSDEHLPAYVAEIERRRLRFLEGYPSTLYILASHLLRAGRTLPMRAVISSSETLHAAQREAIEAAFECRLFDFYALAERTIYAGECEAHQGKHVAEDYGYVEIVDEDGNPCPDGTPGYLVGTSLHNTAMPLVRYRTSDVSMFLREPCACGRTFRRIADVTTKAEDIVVTPDGRLVSPSTLTHPFKSLAGVRRSQIVQERPDHLLVKVVADETFTPAEERGLVAALRERLGPGVAIEVRQVTDIPREPSGKYRWVISHVPNPCTLSWAETS